MWPERGCPVRSDPQTIDESKQNKLRKEEKLKDELERVDLQQILALPAGRRVMYRLIEMTGCGVVNTDPQRVDEAGRSDTHHTYFAIGELAIGERIKLDMLTLAPELYSTMMMEASTRVAEQIRRDAMSSSPTDDDQLEDGDA